MKSLIKNKYSGQVLAVVLVVMVVGVIIALSLISRGGSSTIQVREEQFSAFALEIADTGLDGVVNGATLEVLMNMSAVDICEDSVSISPGTLIKDLNKVCKVKKSKLEDVLTKQYLEQIESQIVEQCTEPADNLEEPLVILIEELNQDSTIDIEKDSVFSLIFNSPDPANAASCIVNITATPSETGVPVGLVVNPIYATVTPSGEIANYLPYASVADQMNGFCLNSASDCDTYIANGLGNWKVPPISVPVVHSSASINELRLRAVGAQVNVSYSLIGECSAVSTGEIMQVSSIANCNGQSRGLKVTLSDESYAPALFDYVLFNGEGELSFTDL